MIHRKNAFSLALATTVMSAGLLGCPLLKKKAGEDAGAEGDMAALADAATTTVSGTGAKNEASVLRYQNETPLNNEPAVIGDEGTKVRTFPGNGVEVAFLPKGTAVAKIAQYFSTGVLVMFDDASGDGSKLIGWVPPKAFDVAAPPPVKPVVVPPRVVDAGGAVRPPTVVDAGGAAPKPDAGGAPPPTVVDAGGGGANGLPPAPPRGVPAVPPTNGKCPQGWGVSENMCRKTCAVEADCAAAGLRGLKCVAKGAGKFCTSDAR